MRYTPAGFISEHKGSMCFADDHHDLVKALSSTNTSISMFALEVLAPTIDFGERSVGSIPVIVPYDIDGTVSSIAESNIALSRADWDSFETSWDFSWHPLLSTLPPDEGLEVFSPSELSSEARLSERLRIPLAPPSGTRVADEYSRWEAECDERFNTLKANEEELSRIFARIYHMEGEVPIEVPNEKVSVRRADLGRDVRSLISYAVGCMFGRYSLDKPGLVLANQGDGLKEYLMQVPNPTFMPDDDGILPVTDDEYFKDDIVAMFVEWMRAAYGEEHLHHLADQMIQIDLDDGFKVNYAKFVDVMAKVR